MPTVTLLQQAIESIARTPFPDDVGRWLNGFLAGPVSITPGSGINIALVPAGRLGGLYAGRFNHVTETGQIASFTGFAQAVSALKRLDPNRAVRLLSLESDDDPSRWVLLFMDTNLSTVHAAICHRNESKRIALQGDGG